MKEEKDRTSASPSVPSGYQANETGSNWDNITGEDSRPGDVDSGNVSPWIAIPVPSDDEDCPEGNTKAEQYCTGDGEDDEGIAQNKEAGNN